VIGVDTSQTFARLAEARFVARVINGRVNFSVSPFLTIANLLQYDNRSKNLAWQSRLRWILAPGNDAFIVFSQGWIRDESGDRSFQTDDTKLSAKVQYTLRM
jgi:hypothetical protein